jgi:glycerol-3-phosphate dehydrogenase
VKQEGLFDVAVIGAGVVGSAIARELSKYDLSCVLVEAKSDIGTGSSKANTGILHTGFDTKPNTLENKLVLRGYKLLSKYSREAGIPIEKTGGILVAWEKEQLEKLPAIREQAITNGCIGVEIVSQETIYQYEPKLRDGALGGIVIPGESIICPFTTPLAFATQAVINNVKLLLNSKVNNIFPTNEEFYRINTQSNSFGSKFVINAAGLYSDEIDKFFGHDNFTITPRRGEEIVFDKSARNLVKHIILPIPTQKTKGILISPTVYGNLLVGPTAEDILDKTDTSTSEEGVSGLFKTGQNLMPVLINHEITSVYAGLRAATEHSDYQINLYEDQRYICVGGIRSTGLSSSLGIAEYVVDLLSGAGVELKLKETFRGISMPNIGESYERPYQSSNSIENCSGYGRIVCYCERVSEREIIDGHSAEKPITNSPHAKACGFLVTR